MGKSLFADPILSGNRDIACITCHDPNYGLSDGVSLGLGAGAVGQGPTRSGANQQRQSRNTPALWALGAQQMRVFFWDGRVEADRQAPQGIRTRAGGNLPAGLSGPLAAQVLFPMISANEMAGRNNPIADAPSATAAWTRIADRVAQEPTYRGQIKGIPDIANALAAYIAAEFRAIDTPYDRFQGGDVDALTPLQTAGHDLFMGRARCATCHTPPLFTDQQYHALGVPQIGPGRVRPFDPIARDQGRFVVTDDPADLYKFRTPALRGVVATAPYGHSGAWPTLEGMLHQHSDPRAARQRWRPDLLILPDAPDLLVPDLAVLEDQAEQARIEAAISIESVRLSEADIAALIAFLHALGPR